MENMFWSIGLHRTGVHCDFCRFESSCCIVVLKIQVNHGLRSDVATILLGIVMAEDQASCDDFCLGSFFLHFTLFWNSVSSELELSRNCDYRCTFINFHIILYCICTRVMEWVDFTDSVGKKLFWQKLAFSGSGVMVRNHLKQDRGKELKCK